jgi:hypothetical protein
MGKPWIQYVKKESLRELNSVKIKSIVQKREKEEEVPAFYGINFEDGGYVVVSSEEGVGPILAYSRTSLFKDEKLDEGELIWWNGDRSHIQREKSKKDKLKSVSSFNIDDMTTNLLIQSASVVNVPSLFETYQTSRWAGWGVYASAFPGNTTCGQGCLPIAMAQILKYYQFPIQGKGTFNGVDFSRQA